MEAQIAVGLFMAAPFILLAFSILLFANLALYKRNRRTKQLLREERQVRVRGRRHLYIIKSERKNGKD